MGIDLFAEVIDDRQRCFGNQRVLTIESDFLRQKYQHTQTSDLSDYRDIALGQHRHHRPSQHG